MYGEILIGWKRGQVWSYDLIIGSILFVMAMAILSYFWLSARTNISEDKDAMIFESIKLSDSLMTPGAPTDWETAVNPSVIATFENVTQIGIVRSWNVNDSNVLSADKLDRFRVMSLTNYAATKLKLRSRYDFFVELVTIHNGTEERVLLNSSPYTAGRQYNLLTVKTIAKTDRVMIFNNSVVILRVYTWSDSLFD